MLQDLKDYLKITWDNEDTYLQNIIDRGKAELNDSAGTELDFETEEKPKTLLLDYCRYYYNNAIEYFRENFREEILELKMKEAVKLNKGDAV
ncbi:MAG TPA: hypothetical protein DEB05_12645 [Firmicutes bacterium]|jgi:hypothetical protein|nr:hypothetical protein [Bacillota bacterium]HCM13152.1 hypothetical protein [Lachnospiraceae bacterium]